MDMDINWPLTNLNLIKRFKLHLLHFISHIRFEKEICLRKRCSDISCICAFLCWNTQWIHCAWRYHLVHREAVWYLCACVCVCWRWYRGVSKSKLCADREADAAADLRVSGSHRYNEGCDLPPERTPTSTNRATAGRHRLKTGCLQINRNQLTQAPPCTPRPN